MKKSFDFHECQYAKSMKCNSNLFEIIYDINQASYPKEPYVSFLDHILVTKNLISNKVATLPIDEWMNSYEIYESYISDHKPVFLSFKIE